MNSLEHRDVISKTPNPLFEPQPFDASHYHGPTSNYAQLESHKKQIHDLFGTPEFHDGNQPEGKSQLHSHSTGGRHINFNAPASEIKDLLIERGERMGLDSGHHPKWQDTIKNMSDKDLDNVGKTANAMRHLSDPKTSKDSNARIQDLVSQYANDPAALAKLQTALQIATGREDLLISQVISRDGTRAVLKFGKHRYSTRGD